MKQGMIARLVKIPLRHARAVVRQLGQEIGQIGAAWRMRGATKLHLGAGEQPIDGWLNLDLEGFNVRWDLTRPLPLPPKSVRFIYTEHFIEHVTRDQALAILQNARALLADDGAIRISTPDLMVFVEAYSEGRTIHMSHGSWYPETPCQMLNEALHLWGHQFVYDESELTRLLEEAGFRDVRRMTWRQSDIAELQGLETRPDFGDLILEARA